LLAIVANPASPAQGCVQEEQDPSPVTPSAANDVVARESLMNTETESVFVTSAKAQVAPQVKATASDVAARRSLMDTETEFVFVTPADGQVAPTPPQHSDCQHCATFFMSRRAPMTLSVLPCDSLP